ncbi:hypothetical protein LINPERHAP2_LOCUS41830 [Linum perenne]
MVRVTRWVNSFLLASMVARVLQKGRIFGHTYEALLVLLINRGFCLAILMLCFLQLIRGEELDSVSRRTNRSLNGAILVGYRIRR